MPWATNVVDSRRYAMELLEEGLSAGQVAQALGVSRQTVQKWKKRKAEEGDAGLEDRSHAPHEHPYAVNEQMVRLVIKMRRKYKEGPRKLRRYLLEEHPDKRVPAASTIGRILKCHGMTEKRTPRRPHTRVTPSPLVEPTGPNDVWCIDFKGEFNVGRRLCYPLTVTDAYSRYVIATNARTGTASKPVQAYLWRAFRRYGLPTVIRSDNGPPFAAYNAPCGLSQLSALWIRLGIHVERTEPGKPYQNGRHERFHKSLKHRTAAPPARTFGAQQKRFDRYRLHYNERRPHEALGMRSPAELYVPSSRPCPRTIPPIEHPQAQRIVSVFSDGRVSFRSAEFHVTKALRGQTVGLTEFEDDLYEVTYGPLCLAHVSFRGSEPRVLTFR